MGPLADSLAAPAQFVADVYAENDEFTSTIRDILDNVDALSPAEAWTITAEGLVAMIGPDTHKLFTVLDVMQEKVLESPRWSVIASIALYTALLEQPNLKKVGDDDFEKGTVNGVELALKRITSDCSATCEQLFKISDDWSSEQASKIIDFVVCNLENGGPLPTTTLACNMLDYMVESFYTFLNKNLHVLQDFYICVTRLLDEASPNKECARLTRSLEVLYNGDNERSPDQQMTIEGLFDITGRTYSFELVGEKVTINVHGSPPTVAPEYQPFNEEAEWKNGPAGHLVKQLRDSTTMNMTHTSETAAYATLTAMIDSGNVFNGFNLRLLIQVFFEKGPVFDGTDTNGRSNRLTQLLDRLRSRAETSTFKVRRDIEDLRIILGRDDKVVEEAALMNIEAGERLVDIEETLEDGMARLGCAD